MLRSSLGAICALYLSHFVALARAADNPPPTPEAPKVAAASDEGEKAMKGFRVPAGFKTELFASEPLVANPVAFGVDHQGRVYVCETFRQQRGVEDNRGHGHWLDDDLAAQTVADRLAYIKKHLKEKADDYAKQDDRIRLLVDRDGDGRADTATVFAEGFNNIVDGTGAGVLAYRGDVFFTCIPKLWKLRDNDGDGKADAREALHDGYGVRFAFRGHDMHGLIIGPDGRLYFSIGDRGLNVRQGDRHFVSPATGAVLRCELDGSNLEMFATGLRNPQELAFDDYGNLFTGDNNSDSGDKARWVYVVEGGDTGWRMYYQYLPDRGPFNREKIWHPAHAGQPAYIVPPITNFASGPSGLAFDPGTGLSEHFRKRFFLCDFRGGPNGSGIRTFRNKPAGAGFELVNAEESFWNVLATDVDFGVDGSLLVSDWVNGWNGEGKGRLYRFQVDSSPTPEVIEVRDLLAKGLGDKSPEALVKLLAHADRRIRQEAQFELVRRKDVAPLIAATKPGDHLLARLHGVWGLAQLARLGGDRAQCVAALQPLLEDQESEIRARAAHVLGDLKVTAAGEKFAALTADPEPRVRFFAASALGKVGGGMNELFALAADNADKDAFLRHAVIIGLTGVADEPALVNAAVAHASASVRLATVVALRKRNSLAAAKFLNDADPLVVVEAARAIHDTSLTEALPQLAALITRPSKDDALLRRVLNANFRVGSPEHAAALAKFAARTDAPESLRLEALAMLAAWGEPSNKDRVTNEWRPLPPRSADAAITAVKATLPALLAGPDKVRNEAAKTAAKFGVRDVGPALIEMFEDAGRAPETRAEALLALDALKDAKLPELQKRGLDDKAAAVRIAARNLVAKSDAMAALPLLEKAALEGEISERQAALATLATVTIPGTNAVIERTLDALMLGEYPAEAALDVLEAAEKRAAGGLKAKLKQYAAARPAGDDLAGYRETLSGGNADRGRQAFFEKTDISCVRCHKVGGIGGDVGPDLSQIGKDKTREYLLESIVVPNKAIAKNFESALVIDDHGTVHSGVVRFEDAERLDLMTAEGKLVKLAKSSIEERRPGKSPMPEDLTKKMSKREVRDIVEFLKGLGESSK